MAPEPDPSERISPARLALAMLLLSFATVLFTLSVWKLLSFFIMPSLFFDLLFIGFPLGACLGVKLFPGTLASFRRTLWLLQGVMLASIALSLACKHFDYLRANLFEVKLERLLGQMATFTVLFLPFFCAYGLSEYVGYQVGTRHFGGRMRLVYALYLFGAACAYFFLKVALTAAGISGLLALSLLLVAAASAILEARPLARAAWAIEAAVLIAAVAVPGLRTGMERGFLELYKGASRQSTHTYVAGGYEPRFQEWGRYSLTEILWSSREGQFTGFYNDFMQWELTPRTGFSERMLGAVPINAAPPGARIAIIGAGGGRQVLWAQLPCFRFERILAIELEPAVIRGVRGELRAEFSNVYEGPQVEVVVHEARGLMERSQERFDLIFLPSVGGYPQMMLEPGNMIRTYDAYRTLQGRLTDRGVLAIWYPRGLDPKHVLTEQYLRTLGAQGLRMKVQGYVNGYEILILAARNTDARLPTTDDIDEFLIRTPTHASGLPPRADGELARAQYFHALDDPAFKPITDEQPFLAGNVRHIFSLAQVYQLFGIAAAALGLAFAAFFFGLRRTGDPGIPGKSYARVAWLSFLIGANFILFEHFLILALFKKLYIFLDAVTLGAISFLVLSGLGSVLVAPRARTWVQLAGAILLVPALLFEGRLPAEALIALTAPIAFATGSFFPGIFELAARNPLAVFAMDAVGAAVGSALAFFLPIAFGFSAFFPLCGAAFVATALATWRFTRAPAAAPRPAAIIHSP